MCETIQLTRTRMFIIIIIIIIISIIITINISISLTLGTDTLWEFLSEPRTSVNGSLLHWSQISNILSNAAFSEYQWDSYMCKLFCCTGISMFIVIIIIIIVTSLGFRV
jgi:hypothetical protein